MALGKNNKQTTNKQTINKQQKQSKKIQNCSQIRALKKTNKMTNKEITFCRHKSPKKVCQIAIHTDNRALQLITTN